MINIEQELDMYRNKLETLVDLNEVVLDLVPKDQTFASSLIEQFMGTHALSSKQWEWVEKLADRVKKAEPIYGDFNAIQVMFMLAGEKLKRPKIRLLSKEDTFVQLTFLPDTKDIEIHRDGWQGHGKRKFVGWIRKDMIVPHNPEYLTDDVRMVIHEFSLDPSAVSKAMANKLGVCIYCAHRLSDPLSKRLGYGPTCAKHYGLPRK